MEYIKGRTIGDILSENMDQVEYTFYSKVGEVQSRSNARFTCPSHDRQTDFTYYIGVEVRNFDSVPQG